MTSNMEGSSTVEDPAVSADASSSKLPLRRAGSVDSVVLDVDDGHGAPPRLGSGGRAAESRKLPSSQYKGVVPQPNGRWGAQIYEKHHRVWLGTFDSEVEAARAYDVAARRFRGRDAVTNLGPVDDEAELEFAGSRSKAEVVDMLRKHTYRDELNQSRRSRPGSPGRKRKAGPDGRAGAGVGRERLFEKVVTPSDVGKLNRLVVPKQHAERHFPLKSGSLLLSFEDECGRVWRFRYSYWNSSQSYVLTKGWSRFVKEKGLKAGGAVVFQRSVGAEKQLYIECKLVGSSAEKLPAAPAIRLFGVNIGRKDPAALGGKEMEFLPVTKKQCIGDQL